MRKLSEFEKCKLSFPDCIVEDMQYAISSGFVKIKTNSGYLSIDGGIELRSCGLFFKNWELVKARLYRTKTKEWEDLSEGDVEKLADICEFKYENGNVVLSGFGKESWQWIEISFTNAVLDVECD